MEVANELSMNPTAAMVVPTKLTSRHPNLFNRGPTNIPEKDTKYENLNFECFIDSDSGLTIGESYYCDGNAWLL